MYNTTILFRPECLIIHDPGTSLDKRTVQRCRDGTEWHEHKKLLNAEPTEKIERFLGDGHRASHLPGLWRCTSRIKSETKPDQLWRATGGNWSKCAVFYCKLQTFLPKTARLKIGVFITFCLHCVLARNVQFLPSIIVRPQLKPPPARHNQGLSQSYEKRLTSQM